MSILMSQPQTDLFGYTAPQGELFASKDMRPTWKPPVIDPDDVRRRLHKMLNKARASEDELPWSLETTLRNRVIFPQMANWLPHEEAEELRAAFRKELERFDLEV
jgi:hypothetical protein